MRTLRRGEAELVPARVPAIEGDWVTHAKCGTVEVLMDLGHGLLRVRTDTSERTIPRYEVRPATEEEQQAAVERRAQALARRDRGLHIRPHP